MLSTISRIHCLKKSEQIQVFYFYQDKYIDPYALIKLNDEEIINNLHVSKTFNSESMLVFFKTTASKQLYYSSNEFQNSHRPPQREVESMSKKEPKSTLSYQSTFMHYENLNYTQKLNLDPPLKNLISPLTKL